MMVLEPEESHYTAALNVSYTDPSRPDDQYAFLPALRRYQPISTLARCSATPGTDTTSEEQHSGFDSNLTQLKVDFLGEKKTPCSGRRRAASKPGFHRISISRSDGQPQGGANDRCAVYVISLSKLPSYASGYCYGKKVIFVDKQFSAPLWEDMLIHVTGY
jgi:hypothetical protein